MRIFQWLSTVFFTMLMVIAWVWAGLPKDGLDLLFCILSHIVYVTILFLIWKGFEGFE